MIPVAFILGRGAFHDIYGDECLQALVPHARLLAPPLSAEELQASPPAWLDEVEVLFTGWETPPLSAEWLARMPRLKVVLYGAGSLRGLVTDACWERGLILANAAALNAIPTAEYAFGAILLSLKRAWYHARLIQERRTYPVPPHPPAFHFPGGRGSTVGLVSLGQVGRRVAQWLASMDVNVVAYDPFAPARLFDELRIRPIPLEEVFTTADVVSLHTPLLPETRGLIGRSLLNRLRTGATLINTSRGAIVREDELVAFLRERPDVQAILDVTDPEPPAPDSPLFDLPNLFLTPHIAGSLGPECRRMGRAMVEEFLRYARGEPLQYAVSREQFARMA